LRQVTNIQQIDGSKIDPKTVPSLKISLVDVPFTPPAAEDELPEYGKERQQPADVQTKNNAKALKALNKCPTKLPSFGTKP
jgi:tyrosinase